MKSEEYNPMDEQKTNSNKRSKKVMIILAVILVIVILAIGMVMANRNPKAIFENQLDKMLSYEETANYDTTKMNMDLQMSIEGQAINSFTNLISDTQISFTVEKDNRTQEELYAIKLAREEEAIIEARAKIDEEAQELYINLGELFNKTIEIDISEMSDEVEEVSESLNFMQMMNAKKAEIILKREVKQQLKNEYFSSEKTVIKEEKLTKNSLKMSGKQFKDFVKNVATNLSQNDEFINCFKDDQEVKEYLKEISDTIEDSEISDDTHFEIDLYTTGIFSTIQRIDFVMIQDEETISIQMTKMTETEYNYELFANAKKVLEGTVKIQIEGEHSEVEVTAKVDDTTVTAKISGNVVYDEELSSFDMDNVVKLENLSMEDIMVLYNNFMESELYDIIEELSDMESQEDLYNATISESSSSSEVNVLKTYNNEIVKFNIPDGFEAYSSDSHAYKLFEKEMNDETIDVDVSIQYETIEEYVNSIKNSFAYFDTEDYSNLKISEPEDVQVNGKTFKKIEVSYEYQLFGDEMISHKQTYYAYPLDDENLYIVEIEGADLIEQEEVETFLMIE